MKTLNNLSENCKQEAEKVMDIEYLKNNGKEVRERIQDLKYDLRYYSNLVNDYEHDIEFMDTERAGIKAKEGKLNALSKALKKRREAKDILNLYTLVLKFYSKGLSNQNYIKYKKRVKKFIKNKERRVYKSRIDESISL